MATEIEHKYIVNNDSYVKLSNQCNHIIQGYLSRVPDRTVRVRIFNDCGYLTVKSKNHGDTRLEFEYQIPPEDARQMLALCEPPVIEKYRYIVDYEGFRWEVDQFVAPGVMTVAEIELPSSDTTYPLPPFVGRNVTGNPEYYNSNLK